MLRIPATLFLFIVVLCDATAQQSLVRSAPDDYFNLACTGCTMTVADISITRGQHAIPMNLQKPVAVNLLMWRYYDKILGKEVLTRQEQLWTPCTQLLDDVPDDEMLSLHLNLDWSDSSGQTHRFFLVLAGLTKAQLLKFPVEGTFEADTYSPMRFAAVAQITDPDGYPETYDCVKGSCTLAHFEVKTGRIGGTFEFSANRVGMEKHGHFTRGVFER